MINFLCHLRATDTATMDNTTRNVVAEGVEKDERVRALETILALSALLGNSTPMSVKKGSRSIISKDSVATWAMRAFSTKRQKELLADSVDCPPFTDPSSVLITDQVSLEFELETSDENDVGPFKETIEQASSSADSSSSALPKIEKPLTVSTASSSCSSLCSTSSRVRFQDTVDLVVIPSHRDMDASTIEKIWTSIDEVQVNMHRNSMEYHADGRDWQDATEEEDMILDHETGDYVHPATWEDLKLQRYQEEQAKAQRQHRIQYLQHQAAKAAVVETAAAATSGSPKIKKRRRRKGTPSPKVKGSSRGRFAVPTAAVGASLTRFADT